MDDIIKAEQKDRERVTDKHTLDAQDRRYIRPKKAEKKMRIAWNTLQPTYIYGTTGWGKTAFVKDYLLHRRYQYFSAGKLKLENLLIPEDGKNRIVVIDDLYDIEPDEYGRKLQKGILDLLGRPYIWVILINRASIPSWLAPVYMTHYFIHIGEEDLALSKQQVQRYYESWECYFLESDIDNIWELAGGYSLCHRLIAMTAMGEKTLQPDRIKQAEEMLYDYLDSHVYDYWEPEIQDFFMQISVVEEFDISLAEMITGRNNMESMIERALELGNFLIKRVNDNQSTNYQILKSMRISMLRRMKRKYSKDQKDNLYYNAGLGYEVRGDIPKALEMYEKGNAQDRISGLLIENCKQNPGSGYLFEMRRYYLKMPKEKIFQSAELMAGMSMLQSIMLNLEESEYWYQELVKFTKTQNGSYKKAAKSWIVYLDIALPHRGSMGLTKIFSVAGNFLTNREIVLPEFSVTSNMPSMMNGGKDFCEWSKQDCKLAKSIGKIVEFVLGKYGKGLVSNALAESFFEKGEDNYEVSALANKGKLQAEAGGKLEQEFVSVGILSWLHIVNGHGEYALDLINNYEERVAERGKQKLLASVKVLKIRQGLYFGRTEEAEQWLKVAPEEGKEFCSMDRFQYLSKIRIYLMQGQNDKAISLLHQMQYYAKVMKRTFISIETDLLLAITYYRKQEKKWDELFCEVLNKAEEYHFVRIITREGAAVTPLLQQTKWKPTKKSYFKQVREEASLVARSYPGYLKTGVQASELSDKAVTILKRMSEGYSMVQIGEMLDIKVETVKYHSKKIYSVLGVNSKTAAVVEARKRDII